MTEPKYPRRFRVIDTNAEGVPLGPDGEGVTIAERVEVGLNRMAHHGWIYVGSINDFMIYESGDKPKYQKRK